MGMTRDESKTKAVVSREDPLARYVQYVTRRVALRLEVEHEGDLRL